MNKKNLIMTIIVVLVIAGGAFLGGIKYAENNKSNENIAGTNFQNFRNLSPEERQKSMERIGDNRISANRGLGSGAVNGEILSADDKSITVKLRDGGSKIIFYSDGTEVSKFAAGTSSDLEVGKTVMVNGSANQDGSVTASSIQIRPENNIPNQK